MYQPRVFREERLTVMHALMRAHPLAMLITHGEAGLEANPIPFELIDDGGKGVLRGHLARANDQLTTLQAGAEALVVFQGPQAYITPSWYASKAEHGKVVPTWNYTMVQAHGVASVIEEPAWLRAQVDALTAGREAERAAPWSPEEAPAGFIEQQLKAIVGLEIPIQRLAGKWKVSQNRNDADRQGVYDGLLAEHGDTTMASLVRFGPTEPD